MMIAGPFITFNAWDSKALKVNFRLGSNADMFPDRSISGVSK